MLDTKGYRKAQTKYVILIAFPWQQWFYEPTYIACLIIVAVMEKEQISGSRKKITLLENREHFSGIYILKWLYIQNWVLSIDLTIVVIVVG